MEWVYCYNSEAHTKLQQKTYNTQQTQENYDTKLYIAKPNETNSLL